MLSIFRNPEKNVWCRYGAGFEHARHLLNRWEGKTFTGNISVQKTYYRGLGLTVNHWTSTTDVTILSDRNFLASETVTNGKL